MGRNDGGRRLTPEEERLWREAMADAEKRGRKPGRRKASEANIPGAPDKPRRIPVPRDTHVPLDRRALPPLPPAAGKGAAPGLDKRTAERFRRGRMAIDARLDLHGLTQDKAHRALNAFMAQAHGGGARCVLVITGKGSSPKDDDAGFMPDRSRGVLREMVPRWLNEPANRARILAIQPAQPKHGGSGAFYVLLKRVRGAS